MKGSLDILRGELERLFSNTALKDLCQVYLDVEPDDASLVDEAKAVFVRRVMDWCEKEKAVEALADAVMIAKKGMVDPRVKQIYQARYARGVEFGTELAGFRVGEQISVDGVGTVSACEPLGEAEEGARFGIWVINGEHSRDRTAVNRFLTAIRALKSVENPAIQKVVAAGSLGDGRPYVIVRWIEGRTLSEMVPLPLVTAVEVFGALIDAVDAIHERGLAHADLRLGNVLVRQKPEAEDGPTEIVLLGMGTDKLFVRPEPEGPGGTLQLRGVVSGMAPEVARGGSYDLRSDIYALGSTLYEMVTGKPVFSGRSPVDVLAAHLTQVPPLPSMVSEEVIPGALDELISKLMAKEPAQRPRTLDEIRRLLGDVKRAAEEIAARAAQTGTREDIETWADALVEDPTDEEVLRELMGEAKRCNAWAPAVEVMEEAAISADDEAVVRRLLLAAADAAVRHVKDYEKARQIYGQLLEAHPDDQELADGMLRLLRAEGRFEELIEKLVAKAEATEDAGQRLEVIREIAEVYERDIKDQGKALDYFLACLGDGSDAALVARLEKLADRTGRFEDLATGCGAAVQALEQAGNAEAAADLYKKLGLWYLERLDQPNYALTCFQKVLEYRPADTGALEAVSDLYRGAQQWNELVQVMVRLGEVEPVPEKSRDRLADAARIQHERLSDTDAAIKLLTSVLDEDPAHEAAGSLLGKIYEEKKEWPKLAKLLAGRVDAMPDGDEQIAARFRLGELYEDRLDDLKGAREQYEKVLGLDPRHLDSLKGMERVYARNGDNAGLRDNLQSQLEIAVTPKQRVFLLERLAEIHEEEFVDNDKAIDCYRQMLDVDKEHASALIALTRLFRKSSRFEELAEILLTRSELSKDEDETRELLRERAEVFREDIGDKQRAAEALQAVASLGVDDALETLAHTQEEAGDFKAAVETVGKMFDAATDNEVKIALLIRKAKLQTEKLEELAEAVATLRKARDLAPQNRGVIAALTDALVAQRDFAGALAALEDDLDLVEGSLARADIYSKMGVICIDEMKDEDRAISLFEHALELDEGNLIAGDKVSTLYRERGQWDKAMPIYRYWADSADILDTEKRVELFTMMGEGYVSMGKQDEALKIFRRASDIVEQPHLWKRLGEVALELEEFALAREQFERYMGAAEGMPADEKVEMLVKMGRAALGADEVNDAAKMARQASVMSSDHVGARMLLADVHEKRGDFRGAVEALQRVVGAIEDEKQQLKLMRRAASIQFENLRDADGAAKLLREALEKHPEDRDLLGDLLKIYYATKRYSEVVGVVLRIAELVDDRQQLARYYLTVAKIYQRELKQLEQAQTYFEKAIEQDPTLSDAEESVIEILTERKDWEALEKHYKRAIARLPKDAMVEEKLAIYEPLADLLINQLDRVKDGIMISEAMLKLDPGNTARREALADLYGWGPEYSDKAVKLHRSLLETNPARVDSFRMLYRIHSGEEDPDQAWCTASMLAMLNQASPDERKFYRDHQPDDLPTMDSSLKDDHWSRLVCHDELNQEISAIFSVVGKAIAKAKSRPLDKFGLKAGDGVDPGKDSSDLSQFVNFAAGGLGIDPPTLYVHEGQGPGIELLDTWPPVLVAGKDAEAVKDRMGLAFTLGQQLTQLRPGLFVHRLVSSGTELSAWLLASIKIFVQALPVPGDLAGKVQERLAPIRAGLDGNDLERLQGYVQAFVSKTADVNLKRWARSVDYTGDRAGMLLCRDVAVALRVLKDQIDDKKSLSERLRELTLFTVSEEHHKLRAHLGTALKVG